MKRAVFLLVVVLCVASLPVVGFTRWMRPNLNASDLVPADQGSEQAPRRTGVEALACSTGVLNGQYGISWTGTSKTIGPGAAAGIITFDGSGQIGGYGIASLDGVIVERTWTGTYAVNDACAGSATIVSSLGVSVSVVFVVFDRGKQIQFLETDSGTVMSGVAKRIDSGPCSNETALGTHVISFTGIGTGGITGAALSVFRLDGRGGITGSGTASLDGVAVRRDFTGSYGVRPDCVGTATIRSNLGVSVTTGFVLLEQGAEGYFVGITAGMVLGGTSTRIDQSAL